MACNSPFPLGLLGPSAQQVARVGGAPKDFDETC